MARLRCAAWPWTIICWSRERVQCRWRRHSRPAAPQASPCCLEATSTPCCCGTSCELRYCCWNHLTTFTGVDMSEIEARLRALGLQLPPPVKPPAGVVLPFEFVLVQGTRALIAGHGPQNPDGSLAVPLRKLARALA